MKFLTLAFGRTISDGNFGGHRGDVTVEIGENDNAQACMNEAKAFVLKNLNDDILGAGPTKQQELPIKEETPVATTKEEKVVEKPAKKVTKKAAKKEAKKTVKKVAHVVYDRNLKPHKTMFLAMATKLGLRKGTSPEDKSALKMTSEFLEGKDMFEAGSTEILESFEQMATHNFNDFKEQQSADV